MPDLMDEVEEDLRAERAKRLAQRFGGLALAGALLLLAGVGGWQGWRWWEGRQAAAAAEAFLSAAQSAAAEGADLSAAAERFAAIAREAPSGYRTLARLRAAALLAETGQTEAALAAWEALAADSGVEALYRDLATLLWGLHALDSGDPARIAARLAPLAAPGAPWRASAREVLALAALKRDDAAEARRQFDALLADAATPQGVRERATRLLQGLGS
ncbi:tetratricopeptide repeat protein [Rubritepida flocculans]|uniref:tetratricopeptide repeat protein n=1 Tax=Rubritepida flocculans TaxID=182403 RepID=UPI00048190E6|nr:tetratricopeptide repeat protein [Rubritepida flocculans]